MGEGRQVFTYRERELRLNRQPLGLGQRHFFAEGDTLLDRVGLALCDLNYFPKKELFEAQAFARKAQRLLQRLPKEEPWTVLDVGGGHGLMSLFLASYVKPHRLAEAWIIDPLLPERAHELFACFAQLVPPAHARVKRIQARFAHWCARLTEDADLARRRYVWLGCHACGELADAVLAMALWRREPFVLMPCCPNRRLRGSWPKARPRPPEVDLSSHPDVASALDMVRMGRAQANGFRVLYRTIDPRITPHHRVLVGQPQDPFA